MNTETSQNPFLNLSRLKIVLLSIFLTIVAVIFFANVPWSDWRTAMGLTFFNNAIFIIYAMRKRDRLMAHLLLFGLVVGLIELLADAWLVDVTRVLDYTIGGGPKFWRSPVWMPFAWQFVAIQYAVLGGWLKAKHNWRGVILTGLIGAINLPFYEGMALQTKWWAYYNCQMILHVPYSIILGEFILIMYIAVLSEKLKKKRLPDTILTGLSWGMAMLLCAVCFLDFWFRK